MIKNKRTAFFMILMTAILAAVVSGCGSESVLVRSSEDTESAQETTEDATQEDETKDTETEDVDDTETTETVCVFVCGAVVNEGVYRLPAGSRINDALALAGGFSEEAATDAMNLAAYVEDGQKLYFPTEEEAADPAFDETSMVWSETGQTQDAGEETKVNINTAEKEELMTLSGIGEAKAESILAYRVEHGSFGATEDIMNVSGIGESLYERIKNDICVK